MMVPSYTFYGLQKMPFSQSNHPIDAAGKDAREGLLGDCSNALEIPANGGLPYGPFRERPLSSSRLVTTEKLPKERAEGGSPIMLFLMCFQIFALLLRQ